VRARPVRVPMAYAHQTASGTVTESPLVLTDVVTDHGVVGHGIVFTYTAAALKPTGDLIQNLAPLVENDILAPAAIAGKLASRLRLLGTQGLVGMALAGIDMALWDALARVHNVSLLSLLGGMERPVPAYGAVGYDGAVESAKVAEDWARRGFTGVKAKIGYATAAQDLAVIRAIRSAVGPNVAIMVDYNPIPHARRCGRATAARRRRRPHLDRGANPGARLAGPRAYRARDSHTDSMRRKLVGRTTTCSKPWKRAPVIT
jgi:mandelate racemase